MPSQTFQSGVSFWRALLVLFVVYVIRNTASLRRAASHETPRPNGIEWSSSFFLHCDYYKHPAAPGGG